MPTPNLNIPDSRGAEFLTSINTALQALASCFYGDEDPATMTPPCNYPLMKWADTKNKLLKQRNVANNAWVTIGTIKDDGTFLIDSNNVLAKPTGTLTATTVAGQLAQLDQKTPTGTTSGASTMWTTAGDFTYVIPDNIYEISIWGCGAGGGGQGCYGLGGGSGECAVALVRTVTPREILKIHIGLGGNGSPASSALADATPGADGGNTTITGSFGTVTLQGGFGGLHGGSLYVPGQKGGFGGQRGGSPSQAKTGPDGNVTRVGGKGADCLFGFGGQPGFYSPVQGNLGEWQNGEDGIGNGSGGGGGGNSPNMSASAGGRGADGMVKIDC